MYTKVDQFLKDWNYEADSTVKLMENMTDESLNQKITPDGRSLGFLAWHLIQTMPEMMGQAGLKEIEGPGHDSPVPESAKKIAEEFKKTSDSFLEQLKKNYKDEDLDTEDEMYGEKWKKGLTLLYLMLHHAHHRGQMTVLMRQAGLKVTGVYGPAKEEWAAMGMEPMQ